MGIRTGSNRLIWFLDAVDVGFKFDEVKSGDGCQTALLNASGLVAEDLDALLQVLANLLKQNYWCYVKSSETNWSKDILSKAFNLSTRLKLTVKRLL